jgi:hypothetical protein
MPDENLEALAAEQPTEEVGEAPEPSESTANSESTDDAQEPQHSRRDKRIDELTWKAAQAQRDAQYWREQAEAKAQEREQAKVPAGGDAEPQIDQFDNDAEYLRALARWEVRQERQQATEQEKQRQQQEQRRQAQQGFAARAAQFREQAPDFDQVLANPSVGQIPPHMADTIVESELGPQLAYHLGKNPQEAQRIAALSPYAAARELGRLEAKLMASPARKQTTAPPPVKPVAGGTGDATPELDKVPIDEFMKVRRQQLQGN